MKEVLLQRLKQLRPAWCELSGVNAKSANLSVILAMNSLILCWMPEQM